jgi:hypothetical protein
LRAAYSRALAEMAAVSDGDRSQNVDMTRVAALVLAAWPVT